MKCRIWFFICLILSAILSWPGNARCLFSRVISWIVFFLLLGFGREIWLNARKSGWNNDEWDEDP
ncbi:MAG: hypothetical protein ACOX4L_04525 [Bacillota bacterium]